MQMKRLWKPLCKISSNGQRRIFQSKPSFKIDSLLFAVPSFTGVALFVLLPFLDVLRRSFFDALGYRFVGIKNYMTILSNPAFGLALRNTSRFIAICIPILLITSLLLAVLINQIAVKAVDFFKTFLLIPLAIPVASIAFLWKIFFDQTGLINAGFSLLGIQSIDWMNTNWSFWVLIFSYIWKNEGYTMILWLAGLSNISKEVYEAGQIDGANAVTTFLFITLPLLKSTFYIATVISILNSFKVFREAYLVSGNYPHDSIYLIQHLMNNWFAQLDMQKLCAASIIVFGCVIGIIVFFAKYLESE